MLVLSRKNEESVVLGRGAEFEGTVRVTVLEISNGRVKLGFEANKDVPVYREEVWERLRGSRPRDPPAGGFYRARSCNAGGRTSVLSGTGRSLGFNVDQV